MNQLKVLDLFSGIGGFSLGLERTGGFRTIAFCEIDPFCQKVLNKHWPNVPIHTDITKLKASDLNERPDIICGGFPCQDISVAGKGAGLDGARSGLWWEMHRVIDEMRPDWVLVENVPALRTKGADSVLASLEELHYTCWPTVVGAWAVGALHQRNRVWALAHASGDRLERELLQSGTFSTEPSQTFPAHEVCNDEKQLPEPKVVGSLVGLPDGAHRIKALGNSVVPQIPEIFGRFILQVENRFNIRATVNV